MNCDDVVSMAAKFQVFATMKIQVFVFWVVTPSSVVVGQ